MPFANGYNGDTVQLNHIVKTIEAKRVLIPGLITNQDLSVSAAGEVASFYLEGKSSVAEGTVGAKIDYASVGVKKIDVLMNKALNIKDVLSRVNFSTVSADVVGARVINESIRVANKHNELGVKAIEASATAKTLAAGGDAYEQLVLAIAEFEADNKESAIKPTGALVSPAFYAQLQLDKRFIDGAARDGVVRTGEIGQVAGIYAIKTQDLAEGFILVNSNGVAAPINVNTLAIVDGTSIGYPGGTVIGGELGFGFKVVDNTEDENLGSTGYFVAHFK